MFQSFLITKEYLKLFFCGIIISRGIIISHDKGSLGKLKFFVEDEAFLYEKFHAVTKSVNQFYFSII